jgi:hypothetical protein
VSEKTEKIVTVTLVESPALLLAVPENVGPD